MFDEEQQQQEPQFDQQQFTELQQGEPIMFANPINFPGGDAINAIARLSAAHEVLYEDQYKTVVTTQHGVKDISKPAIFKPSANLGTIEAFCAHIERYLDTENTMIVVAPDGCYATCAPTEFAADAITCNLPFYSADMPSAQYMDHRSLCMYLDQHAGHVSGIIASDSGAEIEIPEAELRETTSVITASSGQKLTSQENSGSFSILMTSKQGVEPAKATFPKFIEINLRRGTREFSTKHRFRVYIKLSDDGQPLFMLKHMLRDAAEDAFMDFAIGKIRELLPGWHVVQGA